jgi:hypothetical protein
MKEQNWQGLDVDENESPDDDITVWEIEPAMQSGFDTTVFRSWSQMLEFVAEQLSWWLEDKTEEELRGGVNLQFRVITMKKGNYDQIVSSSD